MILIQQLNKIVKIQRKQQHKINIVNNTVEFLTQARDLIKCNIIYVVGKEKLYIYQNQDLRDKVNEVLDEMNKQWNVLISGLPEENNAHILKDRDREIKNLFNTVKNKKIDRITPFQNITLENAKTPAGQFGKFK